jgi:hypothetical protein
MAPGCMSTVFRLSSKSSANDSLITHYLSMTSLRLEAAAVPPAGTGRMKKTPAPSLLD